MVIIWGSRLMGKVDVVPGLFHVATQFGHVYYLPLIPTGTYLVMSQDGSGFRGMRIGFSFRSMLMAWARTGLFLAAVIASIMAMVEIAEGKSQASSWLIPVAIAVAAWILFAMTWHRVASRASFRRACELGELVGLNEEGFAMLQEIYGEAPPGGFPVNRFARPQTAAAAAAPIPALAMTPSPSPMPMPMRAQPAYPPSQPVQAIPLEPAPAPAPTQQQPQAGQLGL